MLHEQIKEKIEKQNMKYQAQANKHKRVIKFKEAYLMWIHIQKG